MGNVTSDYFLLELMVNEARPSLQRCMACHISSHHIIFFGTCDALIYFHVGMRRLCQHNFGNNRYVCESGIMLAF